MRAFFKGPTNGAPSMKVDQGDVWPSDASDSEVTDDADT